MSSITIENVPDDVLFSFIRKCSALGINPNDIISVWIHFIIDSRISDLNDMFRGFPHEA